MTRSQLFSSLLLLTGLLILAGLAVPEASTNDPRRVSGNSWFKYCLIGHGVMALGAALLVISRSGKGSGKSSEPAALLRTPVPENTSGKREPIWILAGVILASFILRLIGLDACLWYDEVVTLTDFVRLPYSELIRTYSDQNQHPLFSLMARTTVEVFGDRAWSLRLPAALFGALTPLLLYGFARRFMSRPEPILAAGFLAVSYHHVWFSQSARGYTVLVFWVLVGSWLLLENLRRPRAGMALLYAIAMALAMYTHLTAGFVLAAHGLMYLFLMFRSRRSREPRSSADYWPLLGLTLAGTITVQLYAPVIPQVLDSFQAQSGGQKIVSRTSAGYGLSQLIEGLRAGFGGFIGAVLAVAVVVAGGLSLLRSRSPILWLLVLPAVLGIGTMLLLGRHLYPRLVFAVFPFAVIMIVHGLMVCSRMVAYVLAAAENRSRFAAKLGVGAAVAVFVLTIPSIVRNYQSPKQDYVSAVKLIEAERDPRDPVVAVGMARVPMTRYYATWMEQAESEADLNAIHARAPDRPVWIVLTFPDHLEAYHPDIARAIARDYSRIADYPGTLNGGGVIICRSLQ